MPKQKREIGFGSAQGAEERAYLYLRTQILNGTFALGDRMPEETIAEQIGLSRTPVRDALRRLASEGFIEFRRYVGAIVRVLPAHEVDQLFQVRIAMESLAAELAALHATETMIDELEPLCDAMDAIAERDIPDLMQIALLNKEFHFNLFIACGNTYVKRFAQNLGDLIVMQRSHSLYTRDVLKRSMVHHRELIQALRARNPHWARSVMTAHIENSRNVTLNASRNQAAPNKRLSASKA